MFIMKVEVNKVINFLNFDFNVLELTQFSYTYREYLWHHTHSAQYSTGISKIIIIEFDFN